MATREINEVTGVFKNGTLVAAKLRGLVTTSDGYEIPKAKATMAEDLPQAVIDDLEALHAKVTTHWDSEEPA
jgi:hypothetical protein